LHFVLLWVHSHTHTHTHTHTHIKWISEHYFDFNSLTDVTLLYENCLSGCSESAALEVINPLKTQLCTSKLNIYTFTQIVLLREARDYGGRNAQSIKQCSFVADQGRAKTF